MHLVPWKYLILYIKYEVWKLQSLLRFKCILTADIGINITMWELYNTSINSES